MAARAPRIARARGPRARLDPRAHRDRAARRPAPRAPRPVPQPRGSPAIGDKVRELARLRARPHAPLTTRRDAQLARSPCAAGLAALRRAAPAVDAAADRRARLRPRRRAERPGARRRGRERPLRARLAHQAHDRVRSCSTRCATASSSSAQPVHVSERAAQGAAARACSSTPATAGARVGDLLRGMIVQSANDAAIALAEAVAGTEAAFVARMNAQAQRMGLANTHVRQRDRQPAPGHHASRARPRDARRRADARLPASTTRSTRRRNSPGTASRRRTATACCGPTRRSTA